MLSKLHEALENISADANREKSRFLENFEKSPSYALSWGDDMFRQAALLEQVEYVKLALEEKMMPSQIYRSLELRLDDLLISVDNMSTSVSSNFMNACRIKAVRTTIKVLKPFNENI